MVLNGGAVFGRGKGRVVKGIERPALGLVGAAVHTLTLCGQYIVHGLVCAVADGEPVVTGIENVAALGTDRVVSGGIPAGHILHVSGDGHGLGGTGRKLGGLAVVQQLDGSLLNTVLLVIIGVGQADIELHNILTGDAAGVLDGHVRGDGLVFKVNIQVIEGLPKRGVGQTVTERVSNLVVVVPCAAGGGTDGGGGIALPHDGVKVAGLVVFVADVDVLGLDNGIVHADVGVGVGPLQIAEVLGAGGAGILDGIGVGQMAGGADRTGENVGHTVEAVAARQADLQDSVNAVIVLNFLYFHRAGVVQQHDDLAAVGSFGGDSGVDQIALIIGQAQGVSLVQVLGRVYTGRTRLVGTVLRGRAGNRDNHHVVVVHAVFPSGVLAVQRSLTRLLAGENAGRGGSRDVIVLNRTAPALDFGLEGRLQGLVHIGHSLVHAEAFRLECLHHIHGVSIGAGVLHKAGTHVAALNGIVAREAQQRDFLGLVLRQRQCAVVLQQDAALLAHPLADILNAVQQVAGGGIVRLEGVQVSTVRLLGDELGALGAKELVNVGAEAVHDG